METLEIDFRGQKVRLVPNWRSSAEIAERVADPILMANETFRAGIFAQSGVDYQPRFEFGMKNSVQILTIALQENGCETSEEEVGEWAVKTGAIEVVGLASDFIGLINKPGPEEPIDDGKKETPQAGEQS